MNEQSFIAFLTSLVESIEPICKENAKLSSDYDTYHLQFSHGIENNFWQHARTAKAFFHAIAALVKYAIESFRICHYPETYQAFLHQLELIFNKMRLFRPVNKGWRICYWSSCDKSHGNSVEIHDA